MQTYISQGCTSAFFSFFLFQLARCITTAHVRSTSVPPPPTEHIETKFKSHMSDNSGTSWPACCFSSLACAYFGIPGHACPHEPSKVTRRMKRWTKKKPWIVPQHDPLFSASSPPWPLGSEYSSFASVYPLVLEQLRPFLSSLSLSAILRRCLFGC